MKEPFIPELTDPDTAEPLATVEPPASTDSQVAAANAIKYTAFLFLLLGALYFIVAFLGPMMD